MFSIEVLKQLKNDTITLNQKLKEIVLLVDDQSISTEGMKDISLRIKRAFDLYRSLVNELQTSQQTN